MTILVTGATGKVGREVIEQLSERGIRPRAAVRDKSKAASLGQKAELVAFDFNDEETYDKAFRNVDKLFLLTPVSPDMVDITERLVSKAKEVGVRHIVKLSAHGADTGMAIGRWHRDAERIVEESGIPYTHLRPTSFMQDFSGALADRIEAGKLTMPLGDAKVSYVDTRDVAAVAAFALTEEGHENKAYVITGPHPLSASEVAAIISTAAGTEVVYEDIPEDRARAGMKQGGLPDWLIDALLEQLAFERSGESAIVTRAVQEVTGRSPIAFSQFAEEHRDAWS